jgi:hypothetical protein
MIVYMLLESMVSSGSALIVVSMSMVMRKVRWIRGECIDMGSSFLAASILLGLFTPEIRGGQPTYDNRLSSYRVLPCSCTAERVEQFALHLRPDRVNRKRTTGAQIALCL